MIFNLYSKVAVKLGGESYVFDRASLKFTEVVTIEDASGFSYGEWEQHLSRYSIRAVGALIHVLRKRAGVPSDFETMEFSAADLDVIPLHDDGTEFTAAEVAADITKRMAEAQDPTAAAGPAGGGTSPETATTEATESTSRTSPSGSESGRGNGNGSAGATSTASSRQPTTT